MLVLAVELVMDWSGKTLDLKVLEPTPEDEASVEFFGRFLSEELEKMKAAKKGA